jgi:hypothetical protein
MYFWHGNDYRDQVTTLCIFCFFGYLELNLEGFMFSAVLDHVDDVTTLMRKVIT